MTTIDETTVAATDATAIDLELGTATNLLYGVKPVWTGTAEALFAPPTSATIQIPTSIDAVDTGWGFPVLTLHDDAQSLLGTLYDYRVASAFQDPGAFSVQSGPLALADHDAVAATSAAGEYIGIDLTKGDSFMLVRLRRSIGTAVHPSIANYGDKNRDEYLTADARQTFDALATGAGVTRKDLVLDMKLTAAEASTYLQTMYQLGTHFVSSIEAGDVIFQVFAYPADRFAQLSAAFRNDSDASGQVTGVNALAYDYYTTPVGTGPNSDYGYVSQAGKITALSGDPLVASTVDAGDWNDTRYADGSSIFEAYSPANSVAHFLTKFQAVTPISIGLAPLADLVAQAFQATVLNRLFKGAMLQKYGSAVTVPFAPLRDIDWQSLLPQTTSSWLSTIATPTIDVYQELVDLGSVQMINTDVVESFTVVSMGLIFSGSESIEVPGKSVTIASYILDTTKATTIPELRVTADAFSGIEISVGDMYGALTIAVVGGSQRDVLLDGFRFTAGAPDTVTQRSTVQLAGDVLAAPDAAMLALIATDLQFSVVSAEALMWQRTADEDAIRDLTRGYLDWLSSLVPSDCTDVDLVAVAARAQYLAKAALTLNGYGVEVPYLTFDSYKDYVASIVELADTLSQSVRDYQQKIDAAKQAELTAKTAAEINANIKATGDLLTKYFDVLAQNQRDMATYYGSIADQKRQEFSKSVTNITQLQAQLAQQQKAVNAAVLDFEKALADWETEQIIKLVFQVATDVFTLGVAFAIPSTEIAAVKSLGETAQKIQKVMSVLAALSKLESDLETSIRSLAGVQRALSQLDQPMDMPSSLEWQEFNINMNASLAGVPSDLASNKAELVAAFSILALRGQALLNAQAKQAQILTDIYFNERQRDINNTQAGRLAALRNALKLGDTSPPDLPKIDLIGLTGETQAQLKQVLAVLAKTLALQDGAVQYTYLGAPTAIQSFDLTSLKQVMMTQQGNIINALNELNPPPLPVDNPIEYRVAGVPTASVTGGGVFSFTIQPSVTEFLKYAMVRIDKVVLSIDGIDGSAGGEYLANLSFVGNPFEDRDAERKSIEFNTVQRNFGPYNYDIASGAPLFGDQTGATDASITNVTPFGTWQVSLPPTATNKGLTFGGSTVDIVLCFKITALLVDAPAARLAQASRLALAATAVDGAATATDVAATSGSTLSELLTNMYTAQAVLKGWDVVFNVLEDPVNALMAQQYAQKYKDQDMPIDFGFCTGPVPFQGEWIGTYNKFHIVLGGPLLQFQQNNHSFVTVKQVIKSASSQIGSKVVPEDWDPSKASINDPGVDWGPQKTIDVSNGPYVQGSVSLSQVQGIVQPAKPGFTTQSVVLDFASGSFVAMNLKVTTDSASLNNQLTNWFVTNPIEYIINTVDFSNITTLPALTPTKFMLNVLTTNSNKNILQQFITTNGTQQSNLTINANEPIPDSYDCSLMINTKIMFESIFVASFNQGSSNIVVGALSPGTDYTAWSAQIQSGTVSGTVAFPDSNSIQYRINSNGNGIVWDISGLQFLRTQALAIALSYATTKTQGFQARQYVCSRYYCSWTSWDDHSVDVNVVMSGNYPIVIKNSGDYAGKNQTIQLSNTPPNVDVSNTSIKPTGACECNDNDLKLAVLAELAKDVPGALQAGMANISFTPISLFALESLLFPGGNLITMDGAYVPGDLLVVGHFTVPPTG